MMTKKLRIVSAGVALAGLIVAISLSVAFGAGRETVTARQASEPASDSHAARGAFPSLRPTDESAPSGIPTRPGSNSRLAARAGLARGAVLNLMSDGQLCYTTTSQTSTCQLGGDAARSGVFVAEVHCQDAPPYAVINGVAPAGTQNVSVILGGATIATVSPQADGQFEARVPGAKVDAVQIDGATTQFQLATC